MPVVIFLFFNLNVIFVERKMSKKYFLVEYLSNTNTVIKQPLQQTHRIKFTSFDVSQSYIVFGASSGGIYIFNRFPCKFIKLLPNKEGSITNILICHDESAVAISITKGLIVIIENCFLDSNVKYQTYGEHEGRNVTSLKWSYNELYVGDDLGKITVISLPSKTPKSIFNIPSATLMHLNSSIVQLDTFSSYLLASTRTKTYLCDTQSEQYRQIGKKPRDGHYGAIFYCTNRNLNSTLTIHHREKSVLQNLTESDSCSFENHEDVKIYCARPGCRIWEAKFDGSVICTHQFKESLNCNTSSIIHVNDSKDITLNVSESDGSPSGFSFGKIFLVTNFILSFQEDSFYIFDINSVRLLFWTNYFTGIKDIKILDNVLYIWCGKNHLKTLYLTDIEDFITISLSKRQYLLCSQLCINYKDIILSLLADGKLDKLKVLKEKISDQHLLEELKDVLNYVRVDKINTQKLRNGIYIVNSKPQTELKCDKNSISNFEESSTIANESILLENGQDIKVSIEILYSQYQINKINNTVDTPKYLALICDLENFINLFNPFINFMVTEKNEDESIIRNWFATTTLRYISNNYTTKTIKYFQNERVLTFLKDAFIFVNKNAVCHSCSCSYPLPMAKDHQCCYYYVGCEILKNYSNSKEIFDNVPYMFKYFLTNTEEFNLPLLMQYGDENIFLKHLKSFTYDTWDEGCKLLIKLRNNICLNCDLTFKCDKKHILNWTKFGTMMLKCLNGPSTVSLLLRYSTQIKPGELNEEFYQTCILTSSLQSDVNVSKEKTVRLVEKLEDNANKQEDILKIVGAFLWKKSNGGIMSNGVASSQYFCAICDIPKMPILDEFTRLKCGHVCHKVCSFGLTRCTRCNEI